MTASKKTAATEETTAIEETTEMETAMVIAEAVAEESQGADVETKIYIGASFKGVATGTVYKDGKLTPALEDAIKAVPAIKELIVPISGLLEARKQLQNKDSALSRFYDAAKNLPGGK